MPNNDLRVYPELAIPKRQPIRPISFIVVRYSNEIFHNFYCSECIYNEINEVIEVDNTANLFFNNLSQAIQSGIDKAHHDLIAVVHEDVLLPIGWQHVFEDSLAKLEKHDTQWGLLGSIGWNNHGKMIGHCSDPASHKYHFNNPQTFFRRVARLDEQLLVFHRSRMPILDTYLPGIHHIGRDLAYQLRKKKLNTYAIKAPTIHKYADESGSLVLNRRQSKKIIDRRSLTYLADKACCNEYMTDKWPLLRLNDIELCSLLVNSLDTKKQKQLLEPIILISRGGSGSRLLSTMVQDMGVFLGNKINPSGDSMELVMPIYQGIVEKYRCESSWQKEQIVPRIQSAAMVMIKDIPDNQLWGFKLPESIFLLAELQQAFPNARYVHFVRDPLSTCLRRTHMTARLDNHIGRITMALAYDFLSLDRSEILKDTSLEHMAYTTVYQLQLIRTQLLKLDMDKYLELTYENTIQTPENEINKLCFWLSAERSFNNFEDNIDPERAKTKKLEYSDSIIQKVTSILKDVRLSFGYL